MKQDLFLDFDLTIVDSIDAFTKVYNWRYRNQPNFVPANPDKITSYDFSCICPLLENDSAKMSIWDDYLFFDRLELIDNFTLPVIKKLNNKYNIVICTIGTPDNLIYKIEWLQENLPFINNYILIKNSNCKMCKDMVNMAGGIQVDDIPSNLQTNAERKILFGKIYPWNKDWVGEHCLDWSELGETLL